MTGQSVAKKKVLSIVLLVALVSLAGCIGPIDDPTGILGGDDSAGEEPIDAVPQESNFVMQVDPIGFVEDPTTREVGNYALQEFGQTNETFDSQLNSSFEEFNNELQQDLEDGDVDVELQAQDLGDIVVFGDSERLQTTAPGGVLQQTGSTTVQQQPTQPAQNISNQYFGVVIELDLTEEELTELFNAAEQSSNTTTEDLTKEEYNGKAVFTAEEDGQSVSLAVLDTGVHAFGPTNVVEDAVDTYVGDSEGVDESIIPEDGENTYLSVGSSEVNQNLTGVADQVDGLDEDPSVESTLVTYSTNADDTIQVSTDVTLDSTQSAFQLELEGQDSLEEIRNAPENESGQFGLVEPVLSEDNVEVSSDGATLTVDYEVTTEELKELIDNLQESNLGATPGGPTSPNGTAPPDEPIGGVPQISLSKQVEEAESENPTVSITVESNENVEELRVTEQLGDNERTFENVEEGDEYVFETSSQENIEIYGTLESGEEVLIDFVFVE